MLIRILWNRSQTTVYNLLCMLRNNSVQSYQFRLHEFLQIADAQPSVPVISDVATIHDFTKQISQVFPWNLRVCLQIVVQNTDTNIQVTYIRYKGQILTLYIVMLTHLSFLPPVG
jgi:hypothetical protein